MDSTPTPEIVLQQHPKADVRRALRVIAMLAELHKAGLQRLRCMPFTSPSGGAWRFYIAPASVFYRNHGAILWDPTYYHSGVDTAPRELMGIEVHYSSAEASEGTYFGWKDASKDNARQLAAKFLDRCPTLATLGQGLDYAYAGWFVQMFGVAERGWFPAVFSNSHSPSRRSIRLDDVRPRPNYDEVHTLPLPPPGELQQDYEGFEEDSPSPPHFTASP